jgi:hypothetical protein
VRVQRLEARQGARRTSQVGEPGRREPARHQVGQRAAQLASGAVTRVLANLTDSYRTWVYLYAGISAYDANASLYYLSVVLGVMARGRRAMHTYTGPAAMHCCTQPSSASYL